MRAPIVAANWKMHGSTVLIEEFAESLASMDTPVQIILIPPAVWLGQAVARAQGIDFGIQNIHAEASGAFTGEIAAEMAAEAGATFALVGHSERRQLFGETDEMVRAKFVAARRAGLVPILCVGETLDERLAGHEQDVVLSQLEAALDGLVVTAENTVIAYEPVWAIGTGETATSEQAQMMHAVVRDAISDQDVRILYGGSVNPGNAETLFAQEDIDGGLVGGASLDPTSFIKISKAVKKF
jgi:triosephosphate isomerase